MGENPYASGSSLERQQEHEMLVIMKTEEGDIDWLRKNERRERKLMKREQKRRRKNQLLKERGLPIVLTDWEKRKLAKKEAKENGEQEVEKKSEAPPAEEEPAEPEGLTIAELEKQQEEQDAIVIEE